MSSSLAETEITDVTVILLAYGATAVLFGVTSVQTYLYFNNNRDGRIVRALILTTWIAATAHLAFAMIYIRRGFVSIIAIAECFDLNLINGLSNCASIAAVDLSPRAWSMFAHIISSAVSDVVVRGIFVWRVAILTRRWWITVLLSVLTMVTFGSSLGFAFVAFYDYDGLTAHVWLMYLAYGSAVVADGIQTTWLCIALAMHRRQSLRWTARVVTVLMRYAISTGALVGLCTLVMLILGHATPNNLVFEAIYFILPGLYLNALLATLNARSHLREHTPGDMISIAIPLSVKATVVRDAEARVSARSHRDSNYDSPILNISKPCDIEQGATA